MWYPQVRNSRNQLSLICIPTCSPFSYFQHNSQIIHHMYIFFYFNEFVQNSWCFDIGINIFDLLEAKNNIAHTLVHPRFFSEVSPSSYLGQTMALAGNSKLIYEVCDSKNEKSAPSSINLVFIPQCQRSKDF